MAKNIIITPSPGSTTKPSIDFQGATSGTIKLEVRDDGSLLISGGTLSDILSLYDETSNPVRINNNKVWHAGNDGSGSGLDADTIRATTPSTFGLSLIDDADASTARTTLGLVIGTDVQAYDADLATWAGLTPSAFFQTLVDDADASTARATLGLTIGTHVQAYNANLTTYAGITPSANVQTILGAANYAAVRTSLGLVIGTDVQAYDADLTTWAGLTPSAYFQTLVDDADASAARTTLGLGTAATAATGTSGTVIPFLDGTNTWSAAQTFQFANLVWASNNTDDTNKSLRLLSRNYDTSVEGEGWTALAADITTSAHTISIGGVDASYNAATQIDFYTAANVSTRTGTLRMRITSAGVIQDGSGNTVWTAGNDGSGSGLDADTLRGTTPTAFGLSLIDDAAASNARTTLGLVIGTDVQAYHASLASISGLTTSANKGIYTTASNTYATYDLSATALTLLDDTSTSAMRTTLGLTIGTNVAAAGANTDITSVYLNNTGLKIKDTDASHGLSIVPGSNLTADRTLTITTGDAARTLDISGGSVTISAYGATLTDDADASTARTTLGLGTSATVNTGTSGATIPLLNANNTYSGLSTFTGNVVMTAVNSIKSATQSSLILADSAGSSKWGVGRSIGATDGNDFYLYDYANAFSRLSYTGADAITTTLTGKTDSIVTSTATSGYGAFYPKGSGTNNSYIFFGNATNAERARIVVDNSRNLGISVDGGTTNSIYVPSTGNTVLTGGTNGGASVIASSGYTVLNLTGASSNQAFLLLNNGTGERARIWADNSRNLVFSTDSGSTSHLNISSTGVITANGNTVWHAGNDGSGSGLDADLLDGINSTAVGAGKQGIWVPAGAIWPRTTTGCAALAQLELSTNKNNWPYLAFDATTTEYAQFNLYSNKQFSTSTFTFIPVWTHPSTTTNFGVVWQLSAVGRSDTDAGDVAFGTAVSSTDTGGTTSTIYKGPESSAVTVSTLAAEDVINFQINRLPSDASDTMAVDAYLLGIMLFVTTTANTDT